MSIFPATTGARGTAACGPKRRGCGRCSVPSASANAAFAADAKEHRFPLWLEAFSQNAPGYTSQLHVVKSALNKLKPILPKSSVCVFDRGFDGHAYIEMLERLRLRYCIRQTGKRIVMVNGKKISTSNLAETAPTSLVGSWQPKRNNQKKKLVFTYASVLIQLPKDQKTRRLLIVRSRGYKPLILLTNVIDGPAVPLITAYFKRWSIEESIRFIKSAMELENIRVMTFCGIQRMVLFSLLAYGFLCLFTKIIGKRLLGFVVNHYRSFGDRPAFPYYRVIGGLAVLLSVRDGP